MVRDDTRKHYQSCSIIHYTYAVFKAYQETYRAKPKAIKRTEEEHVNESQEKKRPGFRKESVRTRMRWKEVKAVKRSCLEEEVA